MPSEHSETEELLRRAQGGDAEARQLLFARDRARLCRMVSLRMDRRLAARFDASDVVQEALADASQQLDSYLRDRPLPFYPWLRHFAWERLVDLHRRHVGARRRSVDREEARPGSDPSVVALADRLVGSGTSPSRRLIRAELLERVRVALGELSPRDREILEMRHLEQLTAGEIAAVLWTTPGAIRTRLVRALEKLRSLLDDDRSGGLP